MKVFFKVVGIFFLAAIIFSCKKEEKRITDTILSTKPVTEILYTSVLSGGIITSDGGAQIVARGVCWDVNPEPTTDKRFTFDGTGSGEYESLIIGLTQGKTYFVRAYATNSSGTEYGDELSFTTHVAGIKFNTDLVYGSIADIDGNNYKTISIGPLVWMAENLKTTKYTDGSDIPLVKEDSQWANILTPGYCWFNNNDTVYKDIYGAYYNWFAVSTGKLCPVGWHVPSDTEWQTLVDNLGGARIAGSKIKEKGTNNWILPNKDATNQSGFTGLPAGLRSTVDGTFGGQGSFGGWWSTTELSPSLLGAAWCRWIHGDTTVVARNEIYKKDGFTIRCVKD